MYIASQNSVIQATLSDQIASERAKKRQCSIPLLLDSGLIKWFRQGALDWPGCVAGGWDPPPSSWDTLRKKVHTHTYISEACSCGEADRLRQRNKTGRNGGERERSGANWERDCQREWNWSTFLSCHASMSSCPSTWKLCVAITVPLASLCIVVMALLLCVSFVRLASTCCLNWK